MSLQQELAHIAVAFRVSSEMGQRYLRLALRSALQIDENGNMFSSMRWKALCKRFDLTESEALWVRTGSMYHGKSEAGTGR
jgi:hypothetical protein